MTRRRSFARRAAARVTGLVVALTVAAASVVIGAGSAEAKTVRWACYGNGFQLVTTDYTWAYYLWNHGWDCRRIYDV